MAGWYSHTPVRFILQAPSGEEGYVDVHLSGTNVPDKLSVYNKFEEHFLPEDPKRIHNWPSTVWSAIEEGKVFIGMTEEQAILSRGKPKEINRTITSNIKNEQWVYGSGSYLYFDNGRLTAFQD